MKIETYEKKIAELEAQIEFANKAIEQAREDGAKKAREALANRIGLFGSLAKCFTAMYAQLGNVQEQLLKNLALVNAEIAATHGKQVAEIYKELKGETQALLDYKDEGEEEDDA